jgi:hypothetical protein
LRAGACRKRPAATDPTGRSQSPSAHNFGHRSDTVNGAEAEEARRLGLSDFLLAFYDCPGRESERQALD